MESDEKPRRRSRRSRMNRCDDLPLLKKMVDGSERSMAAREVASNEPPITSPYSINIIQQTISPSEIRPRRNSRLIGSKTALAIAAALTVGNPKDLLRGSSQQKIVTKAGSSRDIKAHGNRRDLRPVSSKQKGSSKLVSARDVTAEGNPRSLFRVSSQSVIATKSASSRDVTAISNTTDLLHVCSKGTMTARAESCRNVTGTFASKERKGPPSARISMSSTSFRQRSSSRTSRPPSESTKSSHGQEKEQRKFNNENISDESNSQSLSISNSNVKMRCREVAADFITASSPSPTLANGTLVSPPPGPFVSPFKVVPGQRRFQFTAALNKVVEAYDKQNLTSSCVSVMDLCNQVFEVTASAMQRRQGGGSEHQQQQRDEGGPLLSSSLVSSSEPEFQKSDDDKGIYVPASAPDTAIATVENFKNQEKVPRQHLVQTNRSVSANNVTQVEQDNTIAELVSPANKSSNKSPRLGPPAFDRPPSHMSLDARSSVGAPPNFGGRSRGAQRTKSATMRSKSLPPPTQNEEASPAVAAHRTSMMEAESARDGEHALEVEEPTQEDHNNNEALREHQPTPKPDQSKEKDAGDELIQAATAMAEVVNMLLAITKASDPSDSFTNTTVTISDDGQESGDGNSAAMEASLISKSFPRRFRSKSLTTRTKPRPRSFPGYNRCVTASAAQQTATKEGTISHIVVKATSISSDLPPTIIMTPGRPGPGRPGYRGRHLNIRDGKELRDVDAIPHERRATPRRTRSKSLNEMRNSAQQQPVVARNNILIASMEMGRSRWDA
jgi:hypothetical protein